MRGARLVKLCELAFKPGSMRSLYARLASGGKEHFKSLVRKAVDHVKECIA